MSRINQIYVVIEYIYSSFSEYKADLEKFTNDFSLVKDDGYVNDIMGYRLRVRQ